MITLLLRSFSSRDALSLYRSARVMPVVICPQAPQPLSNFFDKIAFTSVKDWVTHSPDVADTATAACEVMVICLAPHA